MFRVLVADGEPLMREALKVMVNRVEGFEAALCVNNGEKAIAACRNDSIDLAFLSLVMPGCSGLETVKRIRAEAPSLPLVLITAGGGFDFTRETVHCNISGYVTRPVSMVDVRGILTSHKARYAPIPPGFANGLVEALGARDFLRAYAAIPRAAAEIRSLAGPDAEKRHAILVHVSRRLTAALDCYEGLEEIMEPLPVFEPGKLGADGSVDLGLFHAVDAAFRRNCVRAYPVLGHAFAFVERSIREKVGLEDIVRHCAASQTHVSKIFKKYFGLSVMDYLHLRKLHLAKRLFVFDNESASETAFALGYNEAGYFSKVFKKYEGMTVAQYKALLTDGHRTLPQGRG